MIQRCHNPKGTGYAYYGARGITVCARWRDSFESFLADVGKRPSSAHSIDRINNDGNYEPGNCRWAIAKEQMNNRRPMKLCRKGHPLTPDNVRIIQGWRRCKICYQAAYERWLPKSREYKRRVRAARKAMSCAG
jgi:hypothetical protein